MSDLWNMKVGESFQFTEDHFYSIKGLNERICRQNEVLETQAKQIAQLQERVRDSAWQSAFPNASAQEVEAEIKQLRTSVEMLECMINMYTEDLRKMLGNGPELDLYVRMKTHMDSYRRQTGRASIAEKENNPENYYNAVSQWVEKMREGESLEEPLDRYAAFVKQIQAEMAELKKELKGGAL